MCSLKCINIVRVGCNGSSLQMCSFKCINIVRVGCNGRPYRCVLSSVSTLYEWDVMAVLTDVLFLVQQHCTSAM